MSTIVSKLFIFLIVFSLSFVDAKTRRRVDAQDYETCIYLAPTGQRFGDRLLEYVKAKWISYHTGITLYIRPCKYYENLQILEKEKVVLSIPKRGVKKVVLNEIPTFLEKSPNTFYIVGYYPFPSMEMIYEMKQDRAFVGLVRETIRPVDSIELIKPPKDQISVAVHIRKGSGGDNPLKSVQIFDKNKIAMENTKVKAKDYADAFHPLKFAPEQYYIDQIKALSQYFEHRALYLYIFTDYKNPKDLLKRIKQEVGLDNITYHCRESVSQEREVILSDFFSMMEFDCLIRSGESYFSTMSELLSDHKMIIYPKSSHFEKDKEDHFYLIMDNIEMICY